MAVLFDATDLPVNDRVAAYEAALNTAIFPSNVVLNDRVREPNARIEAWDLGAGISVVQVVSSGHKISRTPSQVKTAAAENLAIGMVLNGTGAIRQGDRTYGHLGSINPVHGLEPFELQFATVDNKPSVSMCAYVDLTRLALPTGVIHPGLANLAASPLYSFFQDHLAGLTLAASEVEGTPAAVMLGSSTTELARALLASAGADDRLGREALVDVVRLRVDAYIRRHFSDQSLGADKIAADHNISVRALYGLFARTGQSLEQQIIHERLEYARSQLTHAAFGGRSLHAIAFSCGFAHPQFFSLRFREAYGMTPRQWREMHAPDGSRRKGG